MRKFRIAGICTVIMLALSASTMRNAPAAGQMRIAELAISYSAVTHLAEILGYVRSENAPVMIMPVTAGPDAVTALRSPSGAELATIAVTPVVTLIGAGQQPVVLATTLVSDQQVRLITFAATGITEDPRTLRGKRIGRVRNTVGEIYLSRLLTKAGLGASDVTFVDGRPPDLVNLLVRGEIDAAVLWDPFIAVSKRQYAAQTARGAVPERGAMNVYVDKTLYTLAFNVVTTRQKMVGNEETVRKYLRALLKTSEYIRDNPRDSQQKLEAWLNLQPGDLDHFMQTTNFDVVLDVSQMLTWLRDELSWLSTVQDVRNRPEDLRPFVDPSLLRSVDPSRVR